MSWAPPSSPHQGDVCAEKCACAASHAVCLPASSMEIEFLNALPNLNLTLCPVCQLGWKDFPVPSLQTALTLCGSARLCWFGS